MRNQAWPLNARETYEMHQAHNMYVLNMLKYFTSNIRLCCDSREFVARALLHTPLPMPRQHERSVVHEDSCGVFGTYKCLDTEQQPPNSTSKFRSCSECDTTPAEMSTDKLGYIADEASTR
jgi:hypothetical protein